MTNNIKFGPAGLGGVKEAVTNLEIYHKLGLRACEVAFTYGIYIKDKADAIKIGKRAKELGIKLSVHAPYWINLNSKDKNKIEQSKQRIIKSCEIGHYLKAYRVVFHPGYYTDIDKQKTYENIKQAIIEIQKEIKNNKWDVKLAPETTGKINVFGSIEEISRLVEETNCSFTLDFAHILAREKKIEWSKIKKLFGKYKSWHVHFSGNEYGEKGEKRHVKTSKEDWNKILKNLPKNKEITLINESPYHVEDSVEGLKLIS
jgi:deoxyribonuclease-4